MNCRRPIGALVPQREFKPLRGCAGRRRGSGDGHAVLWFSFKAVVIGGPPVDHAVTLACSLGDRRSYAPGMSQLAMRSKLLRDRRDEMKMAMDLARSLRLTLHFTTDRADGRHGKPPEQPMDSCLPRLRRQASGAMPPRVTGRELPDTASSGLSAKSISCLPQLFGRSAAAEVQRHVVPWLGEDTLMGRRSASISRPISSAAARCSQ
jgi:hypothetical protein